REALGLEPAPVAGPARHLDQELLELLAYRVARRLVIAPLDVLEDAFPLGLVVAPGPPAGAVAPPEPERPSRRAVQQGLARRRGQRAPRRPGVEAESPGEHRKHRLPQVARGLAPGEHHPLEDRDARVAQDQIDVHLTAGAQAVALVAD